MQNMRKAHGGVGDYGSLGRIGWPGKMLGVRGLRVPGPLERRGKTKIWESDGIIVFWPKNSKNEERSWRGGDYGSLGLI